MREKGKLREIERIIAKKFVAGEMPTGKQICEKQLIKVIDDIEKIRLTRKRLRTLCRYLP
jgi:ATP-dependent RNA helicase DeaD